MFYNYIFYLLTISLVVAALSYAYNMLTYI